MTPVSITLTKEELQLKFVDWMLENFGRPVDLSPEERERWYVMTGVFASFSNDIFKPGQK